MAPGFDDVYGDTRSHYAGGHAIKNVLLEQHPVLWPEHFDVAATEDEVNYGVSAGDDYHPTPYAYLGPWTQRTMSTHSRRASPTSSNVGRREL